MRLAVFSGKYCWPSSDSPSGYSTEGGFPMQMRALSELFDQTTLVVPCIAAGKRRGEMPVLGRNISIVRLTEPYPESFWGKIKMCFWLLRNIATIARELRRADAVHVPIPGNVGMVAMVLAVIYRKPLFIRHCGNWLLPATAADHFCRWFMEQFAGGRTVALATGGASERPSAANPAVQWIFSTSLTEKELKSCVAPRGMPNRESPRLIIVCRQERDKGTGILIESLPLILKKCRGARLEVVGTGTALEEFQQKSRELGLSDRVTFHGRQTHDGVIHLLRQSDLFCLPTSSSEGFPKAVLEALACGLPVVTTRVSVLPQLIGAGCGRLLDEASATAVAESVVEVVLNPEGYRAMSERAVEVAQSYSLENWRDTIGRSLRAAWRQPLSSRD